jgi:hypothetical protein
MDDQENQNQQLPDNQNQNQPLGDTGLEALRREREARKKLESELKELRGKAQAGDILAAELQEYKSKLEQQKQESSQTVEQLKTEIVNREKIIAQTKIETEFLKTAGDIQLNSKFQSLLLNAHKHEFTVVDGVVKTADGKTLQEWLQNQREQYPELFDAPRVSGSGAGISRNGNGFNKRAIISADNSRDFLANLDGIIDGSVVTEG